MVATPIDLPAAERQAATSPLQGEGTRRTKARVRPSSKARRSKATQATPLLEPHSVAPATLPVSSRIVKGPLVRHLAIWLVGGALLRIALVPPEACPVATPDELRAAAVAAGDWIERNQSPDGRFVYGYDRDTDLINPGYNIVRHAGTMNALYQLVIAGETQFLPAADRALDYLLEYRVDTGGFATIAEPGQRARLGAVGFLITGLAQRREITKDASHDDLMRALGRFILEQQESDGSIRAFWDPQTGAPSPDQYGPFATGEAVWALIELDNTFPGEGWWPAAELTLRYMADGSRELKEGYPNRLPDHWATYALEAAGADRLDEDLADYARRLAGYFSIRLRTEDQRNDSPLRIMVRGFPTSASSVGTAIEGMAALYRLAGEDERLADLRADMRERLTCTSGTMVQRQIGEVEAAGEPDPGLALGAWFYRSYTQVDDQQHALSGLLGAEQAAREGQE